MKLKAPQWPKIEDKRLRTAVMVFACLLVADLIIYLFLLGPASAARNGRDAKYSELRKRQAEAILFKKQTIRFAGIMTGVPSQKDMPLLVKELVQTARRVNLRVAAVNYDIPKRGSGELAMLEFSFPAEGRYPDIKRFTYEVETSDHLVGIQDMKLESDKSAVKLTMKLMTYVKGQ
jgi:Tfp pilus assembly protein PilO